MVVVCVLDVALAASPRQVAVEPRGAGVGPADRAGALDADADQPGSAAAAGAGTRRVAAVERRRPTTGTGSSSPPGDGRRVTTTLVPDPARRRARGPGDDPHRRPARASRAGRPRSTVPGRLRVLPEFASRKHLPSRLARLRELDGRAAVQVRGPGTEFDSLREYVIGDDVRSIDWRATARRADVVVRTWRPERDRRVLIVLDTVPDVGRPRAGRARGSTRRSRPRSCWRPSRPARATGSSCSSYDRTVRGRVAGQTGPRVMPAFADALAARRARSSSRPTGPGSSRRCASG